MPMKPKRPCRYGGCPKLTDHKSGYCEDHRKMMERHYEHFARGYDQHERYGSGWRKVRDRYISRHPICEICQKHGKYVMAELVHHKKPISAGGTNAEENLQSLCVSCHERIHQRKQCEYPPKGGPNPYRSPHGRPAPALTRKNRFSNRGIGRAASMSANC